jgi:hypothetical protein
MIGTTISNYRITAEFGEGGMDSVENVASHAIVVF